MKKTKNIFKNSLENFFEILSKIIFFGLMVLMFPLILAGIILWLVSDGFAKKCKYYKICKLYSPKSETCNKNSGEDYVGLFETRSAACYINIEKNDGNYR